MGLGGWMEGVEGEMVVREEGGGGERGDEGEMVACSSVTLGHKLACEALNNGDSILKYGAIIGHATRDIAMGEHVHSHNLASNAIAIFHHDDAGYQSEEKA